MKKIVDLGLGQGEEEIYVDDFFLWIKDAEILDDKEDDDK